MSVYRSLFAVLWVLAFGALSAWAEVDGQSIPPAPTGRLWVKIGEFRVPATTPGARTQPGESSRWSMNCTLKWPNVHRDSTVVYVVRDLSKEQVAQLGKFTVMEDKPVGCDSGADQPRGGPFRMGEVGTVGGIRCEDEARHYLGRLEGTLPGKEFTVECYELR